MIGKKKRYMELLKYNIDVSIVNRPILEKVYMLLKEVSNINYIPDGYINKFYKCILVQSFECVCKRLDAKVIFSFDKHDNKNFNIIVKYPNKEETYDVYNDKNDTLVSVIKKLNNSTIYQSFSNYKNNRLRNLTEFMNIDYNDPNIKKITKIRFIKNIGNKKVVIKYDNTPIKEEYYYIDYLESNLRYNNYRDVSHKYEYKERLLYEKEYLNNSRVLSK